jgi:electron transfer flavoprotein alpha subunit
MKTLILAEHDGKQVRAGSRSAASVARAVSAGSEVELLLLGHQLAAVAGDAARFAATIVADHPRLEHPSADRYAKIIAQVALARGIETIVAASTTFAKDILPRAAALLQAAMASDVTGCEIQGNELHVRRPMYAGGVTATVALAGSPRIITVRASAFAPAEPLAASAEIIAWPVDDASLPRQIEFIECQSQATGRPELTEARVVVSGGRALRSREEFEEYCGKLADVLGAATGCTRALVDAGITPNEWQVGQTGKIVAPELYVALGVSGAIQHLAGMKNSRVVVAINSDADAPIFAAANYALVGDVREIVPQLIAQLSLKP